MKAKIVQGGLFEVATDGTVYRMANGIRKLASQNYTSRNKKYATVTAYVNGKQKHFYVHRLVAEAFIPNPENKPQVNHIDGNAKNNHASNLEWVTAKENANHAHISGLYTTSVCHICGKEFESKNTICSKCLYERSASEKKLKRKIEFRTNKILSTEVAIKDIELKELNDRQRTIIDFMLQGLSINEISKLIGISKQAVFFCYQKILKNQI